MGLFAFLHYVLHVSCLVGRTHAMRPATMMVPECCPSKMLFHDFYCILYTNICRLIDPNTHKVDDVQKIRGIRIHKQTRTWTSSLLTQDFTEAGRPSLNNITGYLLLRRPLRGQRCSYHLCAAYGFGVKEDHMERK